MRQTRRRIGLGWVAAGAFWAVAGLAADAGAVDSWIGRTGNVLVGASQQGGVETTADGGYVVYGTNEVPGIPVSTYNVILSKFDAQGTPVWATRYLEGQAKGIDRTNDGGFVVLAAATAGGTWLARLDASGSVLQEAYLDVSFEQVRVSGNFCYLTANVRPTGSLAGTAIAKVDLDTFALAWGKLVSHNAFDLNVENLDAAPNGGLYVNGWITTTTSGLDSYVVQVNADGTLRAFRALGGNGTRADKMRAVAATSDGLVLAGDGDSWTNTTDRYDVWVAKLLVNQTTNVWSISWQKAFGKSPAYDWSNAVSILTDGSVLVGAATRSFSPDQTYDFWALRLKATTGAVLWQKRYWTPELDEFRQLTATPDGGVLLAGDHEPFGASTTGTLLVKTDANGVVLAKDAAGVTIPCPMETVTTVTATTTTASLRNEFANAVVVDFAPTLSAVDPAVAPEAFNLYYDKMSN